MTSNDAQAYNISTIRQLLLAAFTPEELRRFCEERPDFRPVINRFGRPYRLDDMVDELITYCQKYLLFPELLAGVKQVNPRQYEQLESSLDDLDLEGADEKRGLFAKSLAIGWLMVVLLSLALLTVLAFGTLQLLGGGQGAQTCALGDTWTRPADGMVMVCVPAGEFLMGSADDDPQADADEKPQHTVYLDAFWIDKTEVTNAQYWKCMEAKACEEPRCWDDERYNTPDQPVNCVSWHNAQDYAVWVGGRLPTEAEWEKAARGTDGSIYPWGNGTIDCSRANYGSCEDGPVAVGSYLEDASPYGALDMAGNVWEWCQSVFDPYPYQEDDGRDDLRASGSRVLRGGSCYSTPNNVRSAYRHWKNPDSRNIYYGFRVAMGPHP